MQTKTGKSFWQKRQVCNECGWYEKPDRRYDSASGTLRCCCPACGSEKIELAVGRYVVETTKHGFWWFTWYDSKPVAFERRTA